MSFTLIIQPHDVVLFRDGKPFSAGMDTRARSLFPPTPFTIQGAIRARVLFSSCISLSDYYEQKTSEAQRLLNLISASDKGYGRLRLRGPFLARRENGKWVPYFPLPADVVKVGGAYELLRPLEESPWQSNAPDKLHTLWIRTANRPEEVRGWISWEGLKNYLADKASPLSSKAPHGEDSPLEVLGESDFMEREHRFGIALERGRRTVRESHLYLAEFLRLKEDVAFWVDVVDGIKPKDLGEGRRFLQLGGEARAAYYEVQEGELDSFLRLPGPLPRRFKVVLLTPAWFSGGWMSEDGNWGKFFGGYVRLISAAIPRYQAMGGAYVSHQQTKGFQRPIRRFVPAGSVYFFEHDGSASWADKPFTETPPGEGDYGQIGFGTCVITEANWDYA